MNKILPIILVVVLSGCSSNEAPNTYKDTCEYSWGYVGGRNMMTQVEKNAEYERKEISFSTGSNKVFTIGGFNSSDVTTRWGYAYGKIGKDDSNYNEYTYNFVSRSLQLEVIQNGKTTFMRKYECFNPLRNGKMYYSKKDVGNAAEPNE